MSTTGLKSNTGTASHAHRNYYGLRRISTGKLIELARPFGSITAAWAWADRSGLILDLYETVDLQSDLAAREAQRALGTKGLPR